jgi:hypothetical protein
MEISGIATSISTNSQLSTAARIERPSFDDDTSVKEPRHDHRHHGKGHRGRALDVFRQELRMTLKAHFQMKFTASQQGYAAMQQPASAEEVADEAIGSARQLVSESPATAAKSLISFRAKVQETASYVRETVNRPDDVEDIDSVVAKVDKGLDGLEDKVASNRESTASVLAVDTRTRQRSTIRIRTQEGDVVQLSLKRVDNLSARDAAVSNESGSITSTEVSVSSRSRMILKVEGDLNESELSAIQNVFAKAEQIADEFFGGDIGAAFNLAQGFEFDTEQLAGVSLRFRMRQISNTTFVQSTRPGALPAVDMPAGDSIGVQERPGPGVWPGDIKPVDGATLLGGRPVDVKPVEGAPLPGGRPVDMKPVEGAPLPGGRPVDTKPVDGAPLPGGRPVIVDATPVTELFETGAGVPTSNELSSALESFFDSLSAFLQSVGEGFEGEKSSGSFTWHYSESFKLNLLRAVVNTVAPEASTDAAATAEMLIDSVSAEDQASA